jgi:hypothetical protein
MQSKHYTILPGADLAVIQAWADLPEHHCVIVAQGRVDHVTHSLCVHQPLGIDDVITPMETALAGMIVESAWPE